MRLDKEVDWTILWQSTHDFIKEHEHQNREKVKKSRETGERDPTIFKEEHGLHCDLLKCQSVKTVNGNDC